MKIMVCVKSCLRDFESGIHDVVRGTWGNKLRDFGISTKFFVGKPTDVRRAYKLQSDEIMVDVPDDYMGLAYKGRAICRWARGKVLDYIFICDLDTFIYAKRFVAYKLVDDYAGKLWKPNSPYNALTPNGEPEIHNPCYPYASGGFGYFLSQKAYDEVADAFVMSWAEDLSVGQVLGPFVDGKELTRGNIPVGIVSNHYWPDKENKGTPYDDRYKEWMKNQNAADDIS